MKLVSMESKIDLLSIVILLTIILLGIYLIKIVYFRGWNDNWLD